MKFSLIAIVLGLGLVGCRETPTDPPAPTAGVDAQESAEADARRSVAAPERTTPPAAATGDEARREAARAAAQTAFDLETERCATLPENEHERCIVLAEGEYDRAMADAAGNPITE